MNFKIKHIINVLGQMFGRLTIVVRIIMFSPPNLDVTFGLSNTFLTSTTNRNIQSSMGSPVMNLEICCQVVTILFSLARAGPKSRPKAKLMLSDLAKIGKGEVSTDTLASYMLP